MDRNFESIEITDAFIAQMRQHVRDYVAVILKLTAKYDPALGMDSEQGRIVWAHGKRNYQLRAAGIMPIVGPVFTPPYAGLSIFAVPEAEVREIMADDPAVKAGLFTFDVVAWRSFPGDTLP